MSLRSLRVASLIACVLSALGVASCLPAGGAPEPVEPPALAAIAGADLAVAYDTDVRPVLESRCVVCHGCNDAPCQLLLSSHDGATRGGSKLGVYDTSRLTSASPTRLGIDAQTPEAWREKGFFSVLGDGTDSDSILLRMLSLGAANHFAPGERLPDAVPLDINRKLACADAEQIGAYEREHPMGGMPYGMAPLASQELRVLASWAARGAAPPPVAAIPQRAQDHVQTWETFLNGASRKERIAARYLYEHWFVAHLYFRDLPTGPFFRVVRSRSAPGQAIDEIATVRPYDDPGASFWYRLAPIEGSIVEKTHIPYALDASRLERLRALFLGADWEPTREPGFDPHDASNPFVTFTEIPARSRYQFLLDDAQYFVMTFIRGPVCRGQVAVDVIQDRFFVAFLDPDRDLSVQLPDFLPKASKLLDLPAEHGGKLVLGSLWLEYAAKQIRYLDEREAAYDQLDPDFRGPALDWIWDGDGSNPNAQLTVFRNFDNATVVKGFVGAIPKTAWVLDYPLFERIYYDLVAGYDVFGSAAHQVATRLYMDHLRMQAENLFLGFVPKERREAIRASWYVGAEHDADYKHVNRLQNLRHGTEIQFAGPDVVAGLLTQINARSAVVAGPPDTLNRCAAPPCDRRDATASERAAERVLQRLASVKGPWVALLPEVTLLRVRVDAKCDRDLVYALIHDDAHTNVAFMFGEDKRRLPADDTLSVVRGTFGSYPNLFLEVEAAQLGAFATALRAVASEADRERFVDAYGVRRTDERFWVTSDWLRDQLRRRSPTEAGILDLGRYGNL